MSECFVTVVVACRNERAHIEHFLGSLFAQETGGISWDIVIADGMSDDGTREILRREMQRHSSMRVIDNPGRIVSTGLNAAIQAARGLLVVRMDAHTEYAPDYIGRCVETLLRTGADNVGGPARTRASGLWGRSIAAAYHSRFACGGAGFHNAELEGYVDTVPYGCWRKETLLKMGLFDESLVRNQDDELNLRLTRAGCRIYQNPAIVSWYHPRSTPSALFRQYLQYGFWKVAVIRKHKMPASLRHLAPAAFVGTHVLLVLSIAVALLLRQSAWAMAFAGVWAALTAFYTAVALVAALAVARRAGWDLLLPLPLVFATYHFGYGIGFLAGLQRFGFRGYSRIHEDGAFAALTR